MKKIIQICCLWTDKLLLCLFVFYCSGCSSFRRLDREALAASQPILRVAVSESDFPLFMQRIQELKLVPMDLQQRMQTSQNKEFEEFWVTFRFLTKNAFLVARSEIISTGMVKKIN